jgi:hypothetical protein
MSQSIALPGESLDVESPKIHEGNQVLFRVTSLYGISDSGMNLPLNRTDSIETGPVTITLDPDSDKSCNLGIMNLDSGRLNVRYGIQTVFPALQRLLAEEEKDNALLNPPRAVSSNSCVLFDDGLGFSAQGLVEFLPGSLWAGTKGG